MGILTKNENPKNDEKNWFATNDVGYVYTSPRGAASGPLAEPLCSENGSDWKSEYLISKIVMICDSNHLV